MEVEYALITSSALPSKVKKSDSFLEVDEEQWFDLVEYSKALEPRKDSEKVMVLVVAQGTPEQEAAERAAEEAEKAELKRLQDEARKQEALSQSNKKQREEEEQRKKKLRARSREIMNALYNR